MRDDFKRLGIERTECDPAVTEQHVQAFIDSFIVTESRVRLRNVLRRTGWRFEANRLLVERLDRRLCELDDAQSRPDRWPAEFAQPSVYVDGLRMRAEHASMLSQKRRLAALFSVHPGESAVLFNYEWGVWYCRAPRSRGH